MPPTESHPLVTTPCELLTLAAVVAIASGLLLGIAIVIIKVAGIDIDQLARNSERYRRASFIEQTTALLSDFRHAPMLMILMGALGLVCAVGAAIGALFWWLIPTA